MYCFVSFKREAPDQTEAMGLKQEWLGEVLDLCDADVLEVG